MFVLLYIHMYVFVQLHVCGDFCRRRCVPQPGFVWCRQETRNTVFPMLLHELLPNEKTAPLDFAGRCSCLYRLSIYLQMHVPYTYELLVHEIASSGFVSILVGSLVYVLYVCLFDFPLFPRLHAARRTAESLSIDVLPG